MATTGISTGGRRTSEMLHRVVALQAALVELNEIELGVQTHGKTTGAIPAARIVEDEMTRLNEAFEEHARVYFRGENLRGENRERAAG